MKVSIQDGTLEIVIEGFDVIMSLKRRIVVKLEHITSLELHPAEADNLFHGLKVGANIPGWMTHASFYGAAAGTIFIHMKHPANTVGINLVNEEYQQLILEPPNDRPAEELAKEIFASLPTKVPCNF